MLGNNANIKAVISAEDNASSVLKKFGNHVDSVGHGIAVGAKVAAAAVAAAGVAAAAFGVSAVKAFSESEDAIAQTNAVLKSTQGVAGVAGYEVTRLAESLQRVTKFSDEQIRSGQNLLLTFTKIGKDIFPLATETILDMSTALGQDLKSSAVQLGKALQDPILGITALRRVGVNFSDAQKDVIANLVNTGKAAEAQKLILKELQVEFGGSAKAAGKTFSGQLAILKNSINDVQETVGMFIIRGLTPLATKAAEAINKIDWNEVLEDTEQALMRLADTFKNDVLPVLKQWVRNIIDVGTKIGEYLGPKLQALWNTISEKLVPALVKFWKEIIEPLIPVIGTILVGALGLAIDAFNFLLDAITPVINFMADHVGVVQGLATVFGILATSMAFNAIFNALTVGFNTLTLITIPRVMASVSSLQALITTPIVVPALIIAAAIVSINTIRDAWNAVLDSQNAASNLAPEGQMRQLQKQAAEARARGDTAAAKRYGNAIAALGGGRALGGPVVGGTPYMVGEKGPELFVPSQSGNIIPNNKMGSSGTVNMHVNVGLYAGTELEKRRIAEELFRSLKDVASARNTTLESMMAK